MTQLMAVNHPMHQEDLSPEFVPTLKVSDDTVKQLAEVFKMLSDRNRLKILLALAEHGTMNVTALKDLVDQTQPAVSHHLTLMRMVGLVGYNRDGKHNNYYLASDFLRDLFEQYFSDTGKADTTLHFDEFSLAYSRREPS